MPQPYHTRLSSTTHSAQQHPRSSTRLSTFSITPTLAPSIAPSHLSTTSTASLGEKGGSAGLMAHDMSALHATLARLEEPRLASQRYVPSDDKRDEIGALALGAKLEKALARRMSGQDAVMREASGQDGKKVVKEVKAVEASAA
jgi:hypothetical protein